ncbi:MAG: pentapeptide repeat-containing protein, partial [Acidobacteriota bacterium]|nr:pentapeptide repeat-containing protein [Acidobacteriota bacterium]
KFGNADLGGSVFREANAPEADFRDSNLSGTDFSGANLRHARFGGAKLFAANLCGADLSGARDFTALQLSQARTDPTTILPNGSSGPFLRNSGAERTRRF